MTTNVIFVAGIAEDLGGTKDTTSGRFDANYTDQTITFNNGATGAANFSKEPTGKLHIHFYGRTGAAFSNSNSDGYWFTARDSSNNALWRLEMNNGDLALQTFGTGGSTTAYTLSLGSSTIYTFDFTEEVVSGVRTVEVWVDGVLQLTNSSTATTRTSKLDLDHNDFTSSPAFSYSEFYATENDQSTIGTRLAKLAGDLAGNYTDGSGTFADLDEVGVTGVDLASTEKYSYSLANLAVSPTTVSDVVMNIRGTVGVGTPTQVNPFVRISSTDYSLGNSTITNDPVLVGWDENPAITAAWTETTVNALEVGLEAVA